MDWTVRCNGAWNPGLNYDIPDLDKSEADGLTLFLRRNKTFIFSRLAPICQSIQLVKLG